MADREYVFNAVNNSVSVTTTWGIFYTPNTSGASTTSTSLTTGTASTYFEISGIVINEGESIKKAVLTSTRSNYGTIDASASFQMNGGNYSSIKKMDASKISNGTNYELVFSLRASGKAGAPGDYTAPNFYSMTSTVSDMVLTVTVGAGSAFDGKVSSLNEGDKILIEEAEDFFAAYTLVHHNYNTGKALLFRDGSIGKKAWRSSVPSSAAANIYQNSTLDKYLTETWYPSLPETTRQYLQTIDYPVAVSNNSGTTTINRPAATLSAIESGLGGSSNYGSIWNYTETLAFDSSTNYWTREPLGAYANMARNISPAGKLYNGTVVTSLEIRPTIGVLEDQFVIFSETDNAYVLGAPHNSPTNLYINGAATDLEGLNSEANFILSWDAATSADNGITIGGYAVWYSPSADEEFQLYSTTTETSMTIIGPKKGRQSYYFKVQTLAPEGMEYCDSELSTAVRIAATKNSNVYYYNGSAWRIASPKSYGESGWTIANGGKYYNGVAWVPIIAAVGEVATLDSATLDSVVLG